MKHRFDAVVIGAGALGSSVAFHLAKMGLQRVALVDMHLFGTQTSARAAGLFSMTPYGDTLAELSRRSIELVERFERDTGIPVLYHRTGSLKIARTSTHASLLEGEVDRRAAVGIETSLISTKAARELFPLLRCDRVAAVSYTPGDLYLEPSELVDSYTQAAFRIGVSFLQRTEVVGLDIQNGAVTTVVTDAGELTAPVAVIAAGAWLGRVVELAGYQLATVPTRHQLVISQPIVAMRDFFPTVRVIENNVYLRPANGGVMLGGYEPDPLQYDMAAVPEGFSISSVELDRAPVLTLVEQVVDLLPFLATIEIKTHRAGLPTMTSDGEQIVGALAGVRGLFVAGGCNVAGLSSSPAIGEALAELIVTGESHINIDALSASRPAIRCPMSDAVLDASRREYSMRYWPVAARV